MKPRITLLTLYFQDPDGHLWEAAFVPESAPPA
jgi:predicted lactoylglutathione lyase